MTNEKIIELLNDMSIEEKIGQLLQLPGYLYDDNGPATGPMADMNLTVEQVEQTGSVLSVVGAKQIKKIQKTVMEKQPHHIPLIFMADVINGYRTVFPIPLAQGCSFHPELSKEMAEISAKESARAGLHATFSPMVDLVRDARWGRVMESTGEDVYLNGLFSEAMVKGYQGESVGDQDKISACIKHFAAYGAPMAGRDYNQVELSERTLKEEYLPAYKKGVDANSRMVMTSFNTLGKMPCTGNKELMRDILRDEWGFDGVLISDWAAVEELVYHGVAADKEEAAYLGLRAGVDIDMATNVYTNHLKKAIEDGKVPMEWLNESVLRVLKFKNELGLFENPYKDADEEYDETAEIAPEHRAFARKAAAETFVLLKNDGVLPLPKQPTEEIKKVAFIGPYTDTKRICGAWSLFYKMEENVTIKEAVMQKNPGLEIGFTNGCGVLDYGQGRSGVGAADDNKFTLEDLKQLDKEAIELASEADVVIMPLGEHNLFSGEAASRTEIVIPEHQMELFRKIYAINPNIVVVNFSGRPLDLREINQKARAILQVWFPGTEGGNAIADVLFGDEEPSGRLSMCFPYNVGQTPIYYSELHTGRRLEDENDPNTFLSRYMDAPNAPLFPFGFGLSYTTFAYSDVELSSNELKKDDKITASVTVTNTGKRAGSEVVQLYVRDLVGSVARPMRELKGIDKITLNPGESQKVSFDITEDMLRFYTADMTFASEPGQFELYIGSDSRTKNGADFYLSE